MCSNPVVFERSTLPAATAAAPAGSSAGSPAGSRRAADGGPPRVLMVVESSSGGTGRHVLDLAEGLCRRGCDVHVLYSTGRTDRFFMERVAAMRGVRFAPLPMRTAIHPADLLAVRATRRYLDAHGPFDVIHGHSSKGGAVARLAALGKGLAAFYTPHGLVVMDRGRARWRRLLYLAIELGLSLRTARVIAVAPAEQREAVRLGLGRQRVVLVPNGVDAPVLTPRDAARRNLGLEQDAFVVGFVGRFVSQKAPDVLVRAMRRVADVAPHARLAMVGSGPLEPSLRELAAREGIAGRITWAGERYVNSVLAAFDVLALSSCSEGMPYVVLEAMSAGLPVVATVTAGVESLVHDGENGVVVPRGDADALAAGLLDLAGDPAMARRYGQASLRRVSRFTIDHMVERTLDAYREAMGGGGLAPFEADDELTAAVGGEVGPS